MKTCSACSILKPLTDFYSDKRTKDGRFSRCKDCHKSYYRKAIRSDHADEVATARNSGQIKTCTRCKETKSVTEFFTHRGRKDGFQSNCKICFSATVRTRYEQDKPRILGRAKQYSQRHIERIQQTKQTAYRRRKQNPDWYAQRREKSNEWGRANPEKKNASWNRRRARIVGAAINDFTTAQWGALKMSYGNRCAYCGITSQRLSQDHVIPLIHGGPHTARNIVPACGPCNSRKNAGPPLPFHVIPISFVS